MIKLSNIVKNDYDFFMDLIKNTDTEEIGINSNKDVKYLNELFQSFINNELAFIILIGREKVGLIVLNDRGQSEDLLRTKELGIVIKKEYRNNGIGTKALALIKQIAKKNNLTELWASIKQNNISSKKVLIKNQFEYKYTSDMTILGMGKQDYFLYKVI